MVMPMAKKKKILSSFFFVKKRKEKKKFSNVFMEREWNCCNKMERMYI